MSFFGNRRQVEVTPTVTVEVAPPPKAIPAPSAIGFETVVGTSCVMEGTFQSSSNVRLDGTFSGSLEINGNLLVGETAKIKADVNARNISIAGAIRGNVNGKKVQILRTGRVWGDIRATALTTEEGAFIDGKITMVGHESSVSEPESMIVEEDATESAQQEVVAMPEPNTGEDISPETT